MGAIWDPIKAAANARKHRIEFDEAATVFDDPFAATAPDRHHSDTEPRYRTTGFSNRGRLLVVTSLEFDGTIRIVSARRATKRERHAHQES